MTGSGPNELKSGGFSCFTLYFKVLLITFWTISLKHYNYDYTKQKIEYYSTFCIVVTAHPVHCDAIHQRSELVALRFSGHGHPLTWYRIGLRAGIAEGQKNGAPGYPLFGCSGGIFSRLGGVGGWHLRDALCWELSVLSHKMRFVLQSKFFLL